MNRYLISAIACMGLIACADAGGTLGTNSKRTVVDQEDEGASSSSGGKTSSSGGTNGDPDAAKPPEAAPTTGPGSNGSKGKQEFIKTVFASLSPSCGGCHTSGSGGAPKFWDNGSASNTYQLLDQRALITAQGSMISTKGSHASGGGPALTSAQNGVVGTWLALEAQDRVGQKAPEDILAKLDNVKIPAGPALPAAFDRSLVVGRLLAIEADLRANGRPRTAGLVAAAAADRLVEVPKTP
jgi:mono/diheme cytochrome c family protein